MVNLWKRSMSITSACWMRTLKRSGRWFATAPAERPAFREPGDGEPLRRRVLVLNQPLGRADEVVEDVLLLQLRPGLVPLLAVLAAAAHVGRDVDEALLQQHEPARAEAGRRARIKPAVARAGGAGVEPPPAPHARGGPGRRRGVVLK